MRQAVTNAGFTANNRRRLAKSYVDGPKRMMDLAGAIVLAPAAAVIILGVAAVSWVRGEQAFFGHERLGRGGHRFRCWKLRTMVPNAQDVLRAHLRANPDAAQEWAQNYKLRNDPRVTRFGLILRKTSIDELPQLWNVIRGEMSLVGPRPVTDTEIDEYGGLAWAYFLVRPGITGLWQVSGRNRTRYAERVRLDVRYAFTLTWRRDMVILWKTVGEVLRRSGM